MGNRLWAPGFGLRAPHRRPRAYRRVPQFPQDLSRVFIIACNPFDTSEHRADNVVQSASEIILNRWARLRRYRASALDPFAMLRKWTYSRVVRRADPSTMFVAIDTAARRICDRRPYRSSTGISALARYTSSTRVCLPSERHGACERRGPWLEQGM